MPDAVNDEKRGAIFSTMLKLDQISIDIDGEQIRLASGLISPGRSRLNSAELSNMCSVRFVGRQVRFGVNSMSLGMNMSWGDLRSIRLLFALFLTVLVSLGCKDLGGMRKEIKVMERKTFFLNDRLRVVVGSFDMRNKNNMNLMFLGDISNPNLLGNGSLNGLTFIVPGRDVDSEKNYRNGVVNGRLDVDVVRVLYIKPWNSTEHQRATDASKNARIQWDNIKSWNNSLKEKSAEIIYGMECLRDSKKERVWRRIDCLAQRGFNEWMVIRVSEIYEGGAPNPIMHAQYYSEAYGGVEVSWISSSWNVHQWRDIDQKLWKLIDQSNEVK